jgi:hypothetical protein
LVGIAQIHGNPCWRRIDWTWIMPAIFAIAWASLVASSGPVSREVSAIDIFAMREHPQDCRERSDACELGERNDLPRFEQVHRRVIQV